MNRLRLSGVYVAIMLAGLLIFAAAAIYAIDRAQRTTLDTRLETAARAAAQFVDVTNQRIALDRSDREQIDEVVGPAAAAAVVDESGAVLFTTAPRVPLPVRQLRAVRSQLINARQGGIGLRVFVFPIMQQGKRVGALAVWSTSEWVEQTDRSLSVALAAGAILIAALALIAGNVVTRRALEDAFARQRRFTADASHELRAPLAVIRAEADLALRKERDPAEYRCAMETIAAEADYMEALIGDLLSAARAESRVLARELVDVSHALQRVADRLAPAAAAKDMSVRVQARDTSVILADPHALERALLAIGHNAVRYAPAGTEVILRSRQVDRAVEIAVEDAGAGFSHEALQHALERFWREPGAAAGTGTGLGLAIARSIVEALRGTITLSNAADGGAIVRMRFPAT